METCVQVSIFYVQLLLALEFVAVCGYNLVSKQGVFHGHGRQGKGR